MIQHARPSDLNRRVLQWQLIAALSRELRGTLDTPARLFAGEGPRAVRPGIRGLVLANQAAGRRAPLSTRP
jgi:hypothetical protein